MNAFGLGLGRLVAIDYTTPAGARRTIKPRGLSLVWVPSRSSPGAARRAHRRFHGAAAGSMVGAEWAPLDEANARLLGLIDRITYLVPKSTRSPAKQRPGLIVDWVHAFGDFGRGKKMRGDRWKPALWRAADGALHVVRRPGNRWTVSDWMIG